MAPTTQYSELKTKVQKDLKQCGYLLATESENIIKTIVIDAKKATGYYSVNAGDAISVVLAHCIRICVVKLPMVRRNLTTMSSYWFVLFGFQKLIKV